MRPLVFSGAAGGISGISLGDANHEGVTGAEVRLETSWIAIGSVLGVISSGESSVMVSVGRSERCLGGGNLAG